MKDQWKHIAVIGAAGKMGKGISLLLLQEMASQDAEKHSSVGKSGFRLVLIDQNEESLFALRRQFHPLLTRLAEKSINKLRTLFYDRKDLISNEEIIREFVFGALDILHLSTSLESARDAALVFEAVVEDLQMKADLLKKLGSLCSKECFFFTNTSSIPITTLGRASGLNGRLVGAHFYNPPPLQKLLEVIYPENVDPELKQLAMEVGHRLNKHVVVSRDVPGFIGNGHFLREIALACDLYEKLRLEHSHIESLLMVEAVTRDFLIRPMGIFQLIDYVGLDVWKKIASIMDEAFPEENFSRPLLELMLEKHRIGGQEINGAQKEGFYRYQKGNIEAVYDPETDEYQSVTDDRMNAIYDVLGPLPERHHSWKEMIKLGDRQVEIYESDLEETSSLGARLACDFLTQSRKIADRLVDEGVAESRRDVTDVLKMGFYHLLV